MVESINKYIYYFNRFSGLVPYTYDKNLKVYVKSTILHIYAIIQAICFILCSIISCYYQYKTKKVTINFEGIIRIFNILCNHIIASYILYQKIFQNKKLLEISNMSQRIYYNPKFYDPNNHARVVNGILYVMVIMFTALPLFPLIFDIISTVNPSLMDIVVILGFNIADMWLLSSYIPVVSFLWIIANMLMSLRKRLSEIIQINYEFDYDINQFIDKIKLEQFREDINDLSFIYDNIVILNDSLSKYFTPIIIYQILSSFTNLVYVIFSAIEYCLLFFIPDKNTDATNTLMACGTEMTKVIYIFTFISIIIMSSDSVVTKYDELMIELYNLQNLRNDGLDESVSV